MEMTDRIVCPTNVGCFETPSCKEGDCPIVDSFGKDSYGERGGFSRFTFSASNKFISIFLTSKYLFYPDQMSWDVKSNN